LRNHKLFMLNNFEPSLIISITIFFIKKF
jgi:hypothetical protein